MHVQQAGGMGLRTALFCVVLLLASSPVGRSLAGQPTPSSSASEASRCSAVAPPGVCYGKVDYLFPVAKVRKPSVCVYKNRRRLLVFEDDILIRDYPIGLGPSPVGDKEERGDGRTPEGEFFVCEKNPRSRYNKSLGLSYPGKSHAREGFLCGLLSYGEYGRIVEAHERRERPPWTTLLGGGICIHGGGAHEDWTEGCVALYNFDMNELFQIVAVGTPVVILP